VRRRFLLHPPPEGEGRRDAPGWGGATTQIIVVSRAFRARGIHPRCHPSPHCFAMRPSPLRGGWDCSASILPPPFGAGWRRAVRDASAPLLGRVREERIAVGAIETIPDTVFLHDAPFPTAATSPDGGRRFAGHGARRRRFFPMPLARHGRVARASYAPPCAAGRFPFR